ncbi:MAG: hypothetical protein Q8936_16635 [Bacillota bacterium]|nr:hypothetical protein [Bacillota bacterium]
MTRKKVIEQLESLKSHSESFTFNDSDEIWKNDIIALDYAIRCVKANKRALESRYATAWWTSIFWIALIWAVGLWR